MRTTVIVCSLVSAAAVVVLGGAAQVLIVLIGFDTRIPYNDPFSVVVTTAALIPGFVVGLIGLGFALHHAARASTLGWFIGLLAWPFITLLAAGLMFASVLAFPDAWWLALVFTPLAPLIYAIAAPTVAPATPESKPATAGRSRLAVFAGTLAVVVLAGAVLLFPRGGGSSTPPPPMLHVFQGGSSANCATGTYPPITLTNGGGHTLQWTANTQDPNVTAIPSAGSLAPGASATVTLNGSTSATDVIVQFQVAGQAGGVAKFGCQAGASK